MKYHFLFCLTLFIAFSCTDDNPTVPSYPSKYEYSNAIYPELYTYYTAGIDTMITNFNPIGSSYEDENNILLTWDLDTVFEGIDEQFGMLFSIELLSPTVVRLTVWDNGIPMDTMTSYQINNGQLLIDGVQFDSGDFSIMYNENVDRFEMVFSVEIYGNYIPSSGISLINPRLQHFGDITFGDTDEILSRYTLGPRDTLGIGFGHLVWEKI